MSVRILTSSIFCESSLYFQSAFITKLAVLNLINVFFAFLNIRLIYLIATRRVFAADGFYTLLAASCSIVSLDFALLL